MAEYTGKDGRRWNDVAANKTLAFDTDSGVVQNVTADAKTVTLPAAVAGAGEFIIRLAGAAPSGAAAGTGSNATVGVTVAPNGTDTIGGGGRTSANTSLVGTKATMITGDEIKLQSKAGGWYITEKRGSCWA